MARNDAFYCDKYFSRFSRIRLPGFMLYSENIQAKFPGFVLNESNGLIENLSNQDINLALLLPALKSRDLS